MARALTRTLLPLDTWAEIMGINPLHFNQLTSSVLTANLGCSGLWCQFAYQNANQIAREDLARAIRRAENMIRDQVRYNLLPDWTLEETHSTTRHYRRDLYGTPFNVRGQPKTVETTWKYFVSGGKRAASVIEADATITYSDEDGDGYDETATVTVNAPDATQCEIRVFVPGKNGSPAWEIRPIKVTDLGSDNYDLVFKSWLAVNPDLYEGLVCEAIDGDEAGNYLAEVDVYRVYNDPSDQGSIEWVSPNNYCSCGSADCEACTFVAQNACLSAKNYRLGTVAPSPGSWNGTGFDRLEYEVCRNPDRVRLDYLSGWEWEQAANEGFCSLWDMDPDFAEMVAILTAGIADRDVCDCSNVERFFEHWREDLALVGENQSFTVSESQINNPFGTTRGGVHIWNRINSENRRVALKG